MSSKVLEKFVEAEIYTEPVRAYFNGLRALEEFAFGRQIEQLRQVQLEPYGIADLVNIVHADQESRSVLIQVIECKRDMVNLATYAQAKRYLTALKQALAPFAKESEAWGFSVKWQCILVGHRVDISSDFLYVLNDDPLCEVYTYERRDGAFHFTQVGKGWGYHSKQPHQAHQKLCAKVEQYALKAWRDAAAELADYYSKYDKEGNPL